VIEKVGRGEWIRTTDLLVPNQGYPAISLNTEQIFSCKTSIYVPKVRSWVGSWVGSLQRPCPASWSARGQAAAIPRQGILEHDSQKQPQESPGVVAGTIGESKDGCRSIRSQLSVRDRSSRVFSAPHFSMSRRWNVWLTKSRPWELTGCAGESDWNVEWS